MLHFWKNHKILCPGWLEDHSRLWSDLIVQHLYCLAVRSAITDDGRPPLTASGLKLRDRLEAIDASLGRLEEKGGSRPS
jgi:hypothetical protein